MTAKYSDDTVADHEVTWQTARVSWHCVKNIWFNNSYQYYTYESKILHNLYVCISTGACAPKPPKIAYDTRELEAV